MFPFNLIGSAIEGVVIGVGIGIGMTAAADVLSMLKRLWAWLRSLGN